METRSRLEADRIIAQAATEADALILAAERECAERETREKEYVDSIWVDLQDKLLQFYEKYSELGELFAKMDYFSLSNYPVKRTTNTDDSAV